MKTTAFLAWDLGRLDKGIKWFIDVKRSVYVAGEFKIRFLGGKMEKIMNGNWSNTYTEKWQGKGEFIRKYGTGVIVLVYMAIFGWSSGDMTIPWEKLLDESKKNLKWRKDEELNGKYGTGVILLAYMAILRWFAGDMARLCEEMLPELKEIYNMAISSGLVLRAGGSEGGPSLIDGSTGIGPSSLDHPMGWEYEGRYMGNLYVIHIGQNYGENEGELQLCCATKICSRLKGSCWQMKGNKAKGELAGSTVLQNIYLCYLISYSINVTNNGKGDWERQNNRRIDGVGSVIKYLDIVNNKRNGRNWLYYGCQYKDKNMHRREWGNGIKNKCGVKSKRWYSYMRIIYL